MQTSHRLLATAFISLFALGASDIDSHEAKKWDRRNPDISLDRAHWREAQSCGVACAYMLARLGGRDVDYTDAVAAIPIGGGGSSLAAVQTGLGTMGVSAAVLKAKPAELDRMAMPVIAHLLPRRETSNSVGHFLLLLQVDDQFVRYIEPSYATSIEMVPRSQFLRSWSGYLVAPTPAKTRFERNAELALWILLAISMSIGSFPIVRAILVRVRRTQKRVLLFSLGVIGSGCLCSGCVALHSSSGDGSERPLGPQHLARLVAWNTEADVGALPRDGAAEALFRIENIGAAEVRLSLGSPTCRCSQARLEKEFLEPGESTNVRMLMRSRPRQAGPADAQVYVEADGAAWAETLSIHGIELGGNFPDYTYLVGGPAPARTASVGGTVFLKSPQTIPKISVPLTGDLGAGLTIRDLVIGAPTQMSDCVRRDCSFTVELNPKVRSIYERRELILPVLLNIDGEVSTHPVRLTVLPSQHSSVRLTR
ncbi:MAG TPA: cysteine peptidase family C39 domain-containing protein [Planctomycetaceae bacterium]|nr:cysteine peptidase family C39 domain-containing protein [Planctomycetaceae bacterium]